MALEANAITVPVAGNLIQIVLLGLGELPIIPRKLYLNMARALRVCKEGGAKEVAVALDNLPALCEDAALFETACRLPALVNYANIGRKTNPNIKAYEEVYFVTEHAGLQPYMQAAMDCAQGTVLARMLCNQPASVQTHTAWEKMRPNWGRNAVSQRKYWIKQKLKHLEWRAFSL